MGGFEEYSQQKEDVGYSDRAEERDGAGVTEDTEADMSESKSELESMRESRSFGSSEGPLFYGYVRYDKHNQSIHLQD